ncbi:hypothetical protein [Zavarzinia aquatilis]|uniref:Pyridoxamine 5'-phosphate oxidase putative domain-containing protein n=1 Tax=Zavarzinia aquatilis TaxID=2211142 RepID=A0A317EF68_9PROT|nr:hypothetical protein [Zavarzinia aquatilis]PWR24780.1 hypothetical protein DKG74_08280 [Zavarzinia aquatilis]
MIDNAIAEFVEGAVMTILASRDQGFHPAIGRGVGTRRAADGHLLDTMVSRAQWPDLIANLAPGAPLAVTFVAPDDYRTFQIKGVIEAVTPASDGDRAFTHAYHRDIHRVLTALGVTEGQIGFWLTDADLWCLRYRPTDVFVQTPGPRAGTRLEQCP